MDSGFPELGSVPKGSVFMGSSVCLGQGATKKQGYAYKYSLSLQERAKKQSPDFYTKNISIGGTNTVNTIKRFASDLMPQNGKYLFFGLSLGNEGITGTNKDAVLKQFSSNLSTLVKMAIDSGYTPIVSNCYTRNDFTSAEYSYTKEMNSLIHQYNLPTVNLLGAVDDGTGKYAQGFWDDAYHPNSIGHEEMQRSIVPSLIDALANGKPSPQKISGSYITLSGSAKTITFTPEDTVHSFTNSIVVRTSATGDVFSLLSEASPLSININNQGYLDYVKSNTIQITGSKVVNDNNWHTVTLTHYYAQGITHLYVDSILQGSYTEKIILKEVSLGEIGGVSSAQYKNWLFYRAGMNSNEILEISRGSLLKSSLELYAPLDGQLLNLTDSLKNEAQSMNELAAGLNAGIKLYNVEYSPKQIFFDVDQEILISLKAEDNNSIQSVSIDLSTIGGSEIQLIKTDGVYKGSFTIAKGQNIGQLSLPISVVDNDLNTKKEYINFEIKDTASILVLHSDFVTLVCPNCAWSSNGTLNEVSGDKACEGKKIYEFVFTASSWWAGIGLNLTGWSDASALDFSAYDTLSITYRGPYTSGTGTSVKLVSVDPSNADGISSKSYTLNVSANCSTVNIPLSYFNDISFNQIKAINFSLNGVQNGSGTLYIDNIYLKGLRKNTTLSIQEKDLKMELLVFPNPTKNSVQLSQQTSWSLYNSLGVLLKEGSEMQIDLLQYSEGLYWLKTPHGAYKIIKN